MGRPAKPTALKLVEGNRGKRGINKQEPDPEYLNDLTPPEHLSAASAAVWNEIVPPLRAARMLSTVDVPMLCMGCDAIAQYRHATKMLGDNCIIGAGVSSDTGKQFTAGQLNQWAVAQSMAFKRSMAFFQKFGMSPVDRTRLAIQPQGDLFGNGNQTESPAAKYF